MAVVCAEWEFVHLNVFLGVFLTQMSALECLTTCNLWNFLSGAREFAYGNGYSQIRRRGGEGNSVHQSIKELRIGEIGWKSLRWVPVLSMQSGIWISHSSFYDNLLAVFILKVWGAWINEMGNNFVLNVWRIHLWIPSPFSLVEIGIPFNIGKNFWCRQWGEFQASNSVGRVIDDHAICILQSSIPNLEEAGMTVACSECIILHFYVSMQSSGSGLLALEPSFCTVHLLIRLNTWQSMVTWLVDQLKGCCL